jgi:hypothetical protein
MKLLLLFLFLITGGVAYCQDYNVALIPDSLKKNADAVKRFEELKVIVKSPKKAILQRTYVITILNEEGDQYATFLSAYNKFHDIASIDGTLFNAVGKELKHIKKRDIIDLGGISDASLVDDTRMKGYRFVSSDYPYTVKFESEIELNGLYGISTWTPVSNERLSVQQSKLIVQSPADYKVRFKQKNFSTQPVTNNTVDYTTYEWELQNIVAVERESFQPAWEDILPLIIVAPSGFEYGGYTGDMTSWQGLGKYIYDLHTGRDALPEEIKKDIHSLTDNVADMSEKVRLLYEYLQKNSRYINISFGIGSLQPFQASEVAAKKYGDCKGLSNLMTSMLKEAGIAAYPAIVKAGPGETSFMEDFPSHQFNHEVVCVPAKDTIWLECTNQTISCGFVGSFTANRKALLLKEDGGNLVSTPRYNAGDNLQLRKINASIDLNGNLNAEIKTRFTGQQEEEVHRFIHVYTAEQRQKRLNEEINLPSYSIESSDYKEHKGRIPAVDEYLKIVAPNYASITGKRLFVQPNLVNKAGDKLSTEEPRKFPMRFTYSYRDVDTIHIAIPEGYTVESMPKDVTLSSRWGKYSIVFKTSGSSIDVLRLSERYEGTYPANEYTSFAKYAEDIYKADRSKIVLVKKE